MTGCREVYSFYIIYTPCLPCSTDEINAFYHLQSYCHGKCHTYISYSHCVQNWIDFNKLTIILIQLIYALCKELFNIKPNGQIPVYHYSGLGWIPSDIFPKMITYMLYEDFKKNN